MIIRFVLIVITLVISAGGTWLVTQTDIAARAVEYLPTSAMESPQRTVITGPKVAHQEIPDEVKAVYMSACYASSASLRQTLINLIKETELNAIIIDIKDFSGTLAMPVQSELLQEGADGDGCRVPDMKELIEQLHEEEIYVIARITVFQDPLYTKNHPELAVHSKAAVNRGELNTPWKDHKGLSFVDVGARQYWEYVLTLSHEAFALGFDELNFDYIRYPSDGPMNDVYYTHSGVNGAVDDAHRAANLEEFFIYLSTELRKPNAWGEVPKLSADLFGMTATNYDDLTIGQVLERALPYFDAIAPMVYPSHYPRGFIGLQNPNADVYAVVNYSMQKAVERTRATTTSIASSEYTRIGISTPAIYSKPAYSTAKMRPWLQDFDYGGDYGPAEVRAQIQASYDAGVTGGWMLWSPSNKYTRGGLLP